MSNRIKDAFDGIHASDALKRQTKDFLHGKMQPERKARRAAPARRLVAAFACLALIIFSGYAFFTPVSAISVDVNPSLELGVNRFDRVVSVKGVNEDGAALASSLKIKFKNYASALGDLMANEKIAQYLESDGLVAITVVGGSDKKSEEMLSTISSCGYAGSPNVICGSGSREDAKTARDAGLPLVKYRAYQKLSKVDSTITPEDVKGLSMRKISEMLKAAGVNDAPGKSNGAHGSGSGGNNGKSELAPGHNKNGK